MSDIESEVLFHNGKTSGNTWSVGQSDDSSWEESDAILFAWQWCKMNYKPTNNNPVFPHFQYDSESGMKSDISEEKLSYL